MKKIIQESIRLLRKSYRVISQDGLFEFFREITLYVPHLFRSIFSITSVGRHTVPTDVLFVSGMASGAPMRYRCEAQAEQLELHGLSTEILFYGRIREVEIVDFHDVIILYRTPLTPLIEEIIVRAKAQNKMVVYDIDDLVFDKKYLEGRSEIAALTSQHRQKYFDGVKRYGQALALCDYATTSTECIATEMRSIVPHVFVNRNSFLSEIVRISQAVREDNLQREGVVLGYMSGSSTHNDDLELIAAPLAEILSRHAHVSLFFVGPIAIPEALMLYKDRIEKASFVDWKKLPALQARAHINLAPLVDSLFSNAKSEIKFSEAALVGVPTVASGRKAFSAAIDNGVTGYVCDTDVQWIAALEKLIEVPSHREEVGNAACEFVSKYYATKEVGKGLLAFIEENRAKKIVYIAPSTRISGGVMVIAKHLQELQDRGHNTLFVSQVESSFDMSWFGAFHVPVMSSFQFLRWESGILDHCVATIWSSVREVIQTGAKTVHYFVQNKEYDFYKVTDPFYEKARASYAQRGINFFTMSPWCKKWLKDEFDQDARYVPLGIDTEIFSPGGNQFAPATQGKIRILIEGNPKSSHKNVDESFRISNELDPNKFEVWLISYGASAKPWYRADQVFRNVPFHEMPSYYRSCDILLKSSVLESFSYPPLEMMACGGFVVAVCNPGNTAYLDHRNAFVYDSGDIHGAVTILKSFDTKSKRALLLRETGLETASQWSWEKSVDILEEVLEAKDA